MASPGLGGLTAVASVPGGKTGFETAPVLQRHPRLLTMGDLDLQMAKEQEAILWRFIDNYLDFVPNKSASVVSNSSSSSMCFLETGD